MLISILFNSTSLASLYLGPCLMGRVEVLVPQYRVDGGVGELLPQQEGHLLQVAAGVVVTDHVDRPTVPGNIL